jgi:hypothetical protein
MGDFFESIFWIIIILVWISSIFSKAKKAGQSKAGTGPLKPKPRQDSGLAGEIFRSFGFPPAQQKYEAPKPKITRLPRVKKETQLELKDAPRYKPAPLPVAAEPIKEEAPALVFSLDKLEEGIILAEILGPPKAYQFCRGVGTGIRSGLKNRWA